MTLEEFEKLTDTYPDVNMFSVIEKAFDNTKCDMETFCSDYRFNILGLAKKIQRVANERLIEQEERRKEYIRMTAGEVCKLKQANAALENENERLADEVAELKALRQKAHMMDALIAMAYDEYKRKDIGTAAIAFDYLLREQNHD